MFFKDMGNVNTQNISMTDVSALKNKQIESQQKTQTKPSMKFVKRETSTTEEDFSLFTVAFYC